MNQGTTFDIYKYIEKYILENGYAPTYREIGVANEIGLYAVREHLRKLESIGKIQMKPKSPRAIKLLEYELVKKKKR